MEQTIDEFLDYLKKTKKISDNTMMSYKRDLLQLIKSFENSGVTSFAKVTSTDINTYVLELEKQGKSSATIARNISSINTFFRFLLIKGEVKGAPNDFVKGPKVDKKLPNVLTIEEIEKILTQPNSRTAKGVRDKALLELMYATGIRVSELINMKIEDVNLQLGYIVCRNDKKDRVIPFGNKVKVALSKYIAESRYNEADAKDWLFLNRFGKKMSRQGVWKIIKAYADKAEINKEITPHTLRHSFGAHLLKSGKDIKEVQEIMGHVDIASTSVYTTLRY